MRANTHRHTDTQTHRHTQTHIHRHRHRHTRSYLDTHDAGDDWHVDAPLSALLDKRLVDASVKDHLRDNHLRTGINLCLEVVHLLLKVLRRGASWCAFERAPSSELHNQKKRAVRSE